jgi:hypothetical protein
VNHEGDRTEILPAPFEAGIGVGRSDSGGFRAMTFYMDHETALPSPVEIKRISTFVARQNLATKHRDVY